MRPIRVLLLLAVACFVGAPTITTLLPDQTPNLAPGFFVATNGNDANPGTLASPFLTLGQCQTAMQGSSVKKCYIRGGSYAPATVSSCGIGHPCAVNLGASDTGEYWSYYPPDGYNSADITGGSTSSTTGIYVLFDVDSSTGVTIDGLTLHNFIFAGVGSTGGTHSLTVKNNIIFNGFNATVNNNAAGIMCYGCSNTVVSNNVVHDQTYLGISFSQINGDISNLIITGNVVYTTCTAFPDCGGIYIQDTTAVATSLQVTNNFVRDGNTNGGSSFGSAIYMDDCQSNVTISGNIMAGKNGGNTTHIHGGNNVHFLHNIIDLETFGFNTFTLQTSSASGCSAGTMSGNQFENNIVISGGGGGGNNLLSGTPVNAPTITGNAYHNYAGAAISTGGSYSDANPTSEDPQLTCWIYNVASGSPVFNSPVNFTAIVGGWGPPGYVIPQTGTAPSSPHTC